MDHAAAAAFLLAARADGPGGPLPPALRPATAQDAIAIQRLTFEALGPIGGWKVGAAGPEAPPSAAPMPASGIYRAPARLPGAAFTTRDIESEIAFVLGRDLPPRETPYTRAEAVHAIASCHPGIEILQSRFAAPPDALSLLADLLRHGAYVLGAEINDWHGIDFATVEARQTIAGKVTSHIGNPAGDMIRLLLWLANEGAVWAGGLLAGQIITTGSWTGATPAPPQSQVRTEFVGLGALELRFT